MPTVPVFYATTDGQTRRIADHIATVLCGRRLESRAIDVTSVEGSAFDWTDVAAVVVAASVHAGHHQRAAAAFVQRHRAELSARPSLFVSVSLSICSPDPRTVAAAEGIAAAFGTDAGWRPTRIACVGGRLAYRRYGLLKRWMMRRIAAQNAGPTDTSRDHELTDWPALTAVVGDFATIAVRPAAAAG